MLILKEGIDNFIFLLNEAKRVNEPLIFPTDTIYGIGAPLSNIIANKKIFEIKKRPAGMPFPIIAGSWQQAGKIADIDNISKEKKLFIERNYDKAVTYILPAKNIDEIYMKNGSVAVRVTNSQWLSEALIRFGEPVTATSVNISKRTPASDFPEAYSEFKHFVTLFLHGIPPVEQSSEIYDIRNENIIKIR